MTYLNHMNATSLPDGTSGTVEVKRIHVSEDEARWSQLRSAINHRGSGVRAGTYVAVYRDGDLWMSDTPDEQRDHAPVIWECRRQGADRAILNGLGIGMVLNALLHEPSICHIDVVEIDPDVIALVGPYYQQVAEGNAKSLAIHEADAYTKAWATGTRWDIAWHDVWQDSCLDNLPEMTRLHRRYGRRVRWQESWNRQRLLYQRRRGGWR